MLKSLLFSMVGSVQTNYYDAPYFGLPGQITDVLNSRDVFNGPGEVDIGVGLMLVKGANITSDTSSMGFNVKLPVIASTAADMVGVSVRNVYLPGTPPNTQDSVPYYPAKTNVSYLSKGSMWVEAVTNVLTADIRGSLWIVTDAGTAGHPVGTILSNDSTGGVVEYTQGYFTKEATAGSITKIVLK